MSLKGRLCFRWGITAIRALSLGRFGHSTKQCLGLDLSNCECRTLTGDILKLTKPAVVLLITGYRPKSKNVTVRVCRYWPPTPGVRQSTTTHSWDFGYTTLSTFGKTGAWLTMMSVIALSAVGPMTYRSAGKSVICNQSARPLTISWVA